MFIHRFVHGEASRVQRPAPAAPMTDDAAVPKTKNSTSENSGGECDAAGKQYADIHWADQLAGVSPKAGRRVLAGLSLGRSGFAGNRLGRLGAPHAFGMGRRDGARGVCLLRGLFTGNGRGAGTYGH